jgi:uncharacterized protein YgbK (DUF1537 family)
VAEPSPVLKADYLVGLPPEWPADDLRPAILERNQAAGRCIVALDDDPTGTQTVHSVWVVTRWDVETLYKALRDGDPALYILTNTRSYPLAEARRINREIAANLTRAAQAAERPVVVVSRSDSTLRGHYPGEVDALGEALAAAGASALDGVCLIPFFLEGGRYTVDDVHWVEEDDRLIPAAQTPYAQDAAFGYRHSRLPEWVEEKSGGRIRESDVCTISLATLREGGPNAVQAGLMAVDGGRVVVVNAASYRDIEVFVSGWQRAEDAGKRFLFRSAASFVQVAAGLPARPLLTTEALGAGRPAGGGLIVFGSHVPKSTRQLAAACALPDVKAVELSAEAVLKPETRPAAVERAAATLNAALFAGQHGLIFTSRQVVTARSDEENLRTGQSISAALMDVVERIEREPRFVIGKGGITSSDLATKGMQVTAARVAGQVLPGVPVWRLGPGSRWPDLPYTVFPGNVGDDEAVAHVINMYR